MDKLKIAYNIDWDTEGKAVDLPDEVEIPSYVEESDIADYLSDIYGWCIFNFDLK